MRTPCTGLGCCFPHFPSTETPAKSTGCEAGRVRCEIFPHKLNKVLPHEAYFLLPVDGAVARTEHWHVNAS